MGICGIDHRRPLQEMRDRPPSTPKGNEGLIIVDPYGKCGIDHRRPLRMMDGIDQRRAGSTAVDPYGCGGFITVDDVGSTTVDPYGR